MSNKLMPTHSEESQPPLTCPIMWLTAEEAAKVLRVHVSTVHEMCKRGDIKAIKAGRDWRISAQGLAERAELGDVHSKIIRETAGRAAQETATILMECFARAFREEAIRRRVTG